MLNVRVSSSEMDEKTVTAFSFATHSQLDGFILEMGHHSSPLVTHPTLAQVRSVRSITRRKIIDDCTNKFSIKLPISYLT